MPNNAAKRLIDYFNDESIPEFRPTDFATEWRSKPIPRRANVINPPNRNLTRFGGGSDFQELFSQIEENLGKYKFGRVSKSEWERRYRFALGSRNNKFDRRLVVNSSKLQAEKWVNDNIIGALQKDHSNDLNLLVGGIGAGKSTFNKYITTAYFETFKDNKVVVSRVEYQKLYKYIENAANLEGANLSSFTKMEQTIQKYCFACVIRDFFNYQFLSCAESDESNETFKASGGCTWSELNLPDLSVKPQFEEFLKSLGYFADLETGAKCLEFYEIANTAYCQSKRIERAKWFNKFISDESQILSLEPLIHFANSRGIKFYVIIDGLDYIQISDFISNTNHKIVMEQISKWLLSNPRGLQISKYGQLQPLFQVTMRVNTWELFFRPFAQSIGQINCHQFHVDPPSFNGIFRKLSTSSLWNQKSTGTDPNFEKLNVSRIFIQLQESLAEKLEIRPSELNSLFQNNIRYRIDFVWDVLLEMLNSATQNGTVNLTHNQMINALNLEANTLSGQKSYRLVDMLLCSKNGRFSNFVALNRQLVDQDIDDGISSLESVLVDNNTNSGYISNIFNYHIPQMKYGDFQYFLEKIRILDLLLESKSEEGQYLPLSLEELCEKFEYKGWVSSKFIRYTIAVMVRENFILACHCESGCHNYEPSDLGKIVREKLLKQKPYLENVIFGCLLPSFMVRFAKNQDRNNISVHYNISVHKWVAGAVFHCWLIISAIKTIDNGSLYSEIREALQEQITKVANATPEIADDATAFISHFKLEKDQ